MGAFVMDHRKPLHMAMGGGMDLRQPTHKPAAGMADSPMKHHSPTSPVFNAKVKRVMGEYKRGTLKSSSGAKVRKRTQAIAIGLSEARAKTGMPMPKRPKKMRM